VVRYSAQAHITSKKYLYKLYPIPVNINSLLARWRVRSFLIRRMVVGWILSLAYYAPCFFVCLTFIYQSIMFLYLHVYLFLYLSIYLSIYLFLYLYLSISFYISIYLSLSISLYIYLSLSISLSIYLSIYLSI
jgi:hypothetical protein